MSDNEWSRIWKKAIALTEYNLSDNETYELYIATVKHIDIIVLNQIISNQFNRNWNEKFLSAVLHEITERTLLH